MMNLHALKLWSWSVGLTTLLIGAAGCTTAPQSTAAAAEDIYSTLPFEMDAVQLPLFPDRTSSILEYGAVADGTSLNTEARSEEHTSELQSQR